MNTIFWACAGVTALSSLISAGFSLVALRDSARDRVNAMYASSRSVALGIVGLLPLVLVSKEWLIPIATVMIVVQAFDAMIGIRIKETMKAVGPALLCTVNFALLMLLISAN